MPRFTAVQISFGNRRFWDIDSNFLIQRLQAGYFFHRHEIDFTTEREVQEAMANWAINDFPSVVEYEVVDTGLRIIGVTLNLGGVERHLFNEPLVFPVDGVGRMTPNENPQQLVPHPHSIRG